VLSATFYVTAIISRYTKNIYKNMQLQIRSPESKFPDEYSGIIFVHIDQHLKSYSKNTKGSRFYESRRSY